MHKGKWLFEELFYRKEGMLSLKIVAEDKINKMDLNYKKADFIWTLEIASKPKSYSKMASTDLWIFFCWTYLSRCWDDVIMDTWLSRSLIYKFHPTLDFYENVLHKGLYSASIGTHETKWDLEDWIFANSFSSG